MAMVLPPALASCGIVSGKPACNVILSLTVYLAGPSEADLDFLVALYEGICPAPRRSKYNVLETGGFWGDVADPDLTSSGRAAATAGRRWPFFEPARVRIRQGRAMEARLWDRRQIGDPEGSWDFTCRSRLSQRTGLHGFVRIRLPLSVDPAILHHVALAIADNVAFRSGHGGLSFGYDPWLATDAFNHIYAKARRYWGVDVDDVDHTLRLMKTGIKGVSWITMVGRAFEGAESLDPGIAELRARDDVRVDARKHGLVLLAGAEPIVGDQNRLEPLDPYAAIAQALEPAIVKTPPEFPGVFSGEEKTMGWVRRFVDPAGWR